MILVSHAIGNQFVRALLEAFDRAGMLREFWTGVSWNPNSTLNPLLPTRLRETLQRRSFPETIRSRTRTMPLREIVRLLRGALGIQSQDETGAFSVDAIFRHLDRRVAARLRRIDNVDSVYCYEDGALETFEAAQERGFARAYDLPIAYWETTQLLLREEAQRYPDWEPTLGGTSDSDEKLSRKSKELELSQLVVCPSNFVLESLPRGARELKSCIVVPFGSPEVGIRTSAPRKEPRLRVLFAGSMTQRKGLADVFAAMKLLQSREIELVVMGSLLRPLTWYRERCRSFRYERPRPHGEVLRLMQSCDVFVLPSIVEGRALVQQEAMACGLPVIATKNAGADDAIIHGENGFLVPIRSPEAIADKIDWCAANRPLLAGMAIAARKRAAQFTWRAYGERIIAAVRAITCP
jgi:glycosyltransferase involved in cell wall biosynthesis